MLVSFGLAGYGVCGLLCLCVDDLFGLRGWLVILLVAFVLYWFAGLIVFAYSFGWVCWFRFEVVV